MAVRGGATAVEQALHLSDFPPTVAAIHRCDKCRAQPILLQSSSFFMPTAVPHTVMLI